MNCVNKKYVHDVRNDSSILVAIYCLVYNHEPYLRDCFEGFVMQKTNFRFMAIVHEDCSTDNSAAIIREYEEKYPDLFCPIYETENQYKKHDGSIDKQMNKMIVSYGAKYVAICEGDDYWTDPHKLQKQVEFLEAHPEYSVCWHRCKRWIVKNNTYIDDECSKLFSLDKKGVDIDVATYFSHWYTQPLTMVYRRDSLDLDWSRKFKFFRDMHLMYNLLQHGKGYLFSFVGGVYTMHDGGLAGTISRKQYCDISLPMDREFFWKTLEEGPRINYLATLDTCVKVYAKNEKCKALWCAIVRFALSLKIHNFWNNLKIVLSKE